MQHVVVVEIVSLYEETEILQAKELFCVDLQVKKSQDVLRCQDRWVWMVQGLVLNCSGSQSK